MAGSGPATTGAGVVIVCADAILSRRWC